MNVQISRGFTLIEVLLAAAIMFAVLSVAAVSYKNAAFASEQAQMTLQLTTPLPVITDTVRSQIREKLSDVLHGDGQLMGVDYRWNARVMQRKAAPAQYIVENDSYLQMPERFLLYDVELVISVVGKTQTYQYRELAWL